MNATDDKWIIFHYVLLRVQEEMDSIGDDEGGPLRVPFHAYTPVSLAIREIVTESH